MFRCPSASSSHGEQIPGDPQDRFDDDYDPVPRDDIAVLQVYFMNYTPRVIVELIELILLAFRNVSSQGFIIAVAGAILAVLLGHAEVFFLCYNVMEVLCTVGPIIWLNEAVEEGTPSWIIERLFCVFGHHCLQYMIGFCLSIGLDKALMIEIIDESTNTVLRIPFFHIIHFCLMVLLLTQKGHIKRRLPNSDAWADAYRYFRDTAQLYASYFFLHNFLRISMTLRRVIFGCCPRIWGGIRKEEAKQWESKHNRLLDGNFVKSVVASSASIRHVRQLDLDPVVDPCAPITSILNLPMIIVSTLVVPFGLLGLSSVASRLLFFYSAGYMAKQLLRFVFSRFSSGKKESLFVLWRRVPLLLCSYCGGYAVDVLLGCIVPREWQPIVSAARPAIYYLSYSAMANLCADVVSGCTDVGSFVLAHARKHIQRLVEEQEMSDANAALYPRFLLPARVESFLLFLIRAAACVGMLVLWFFEPQAFPITDGEAMTARISTLHGEPSDFSHAYSSPLMFSASRMFQPFVAFLLVVPLCISVLRSFTR